MLGELLLDPLNIIVANAGGALIADVSTFAANAGTTQTIAPATLDAAAANVVLQATDTITFTDPVALSTFGASLTAQAGSDIVVDSSVETNGGDINLLAGPFSSSPTFSSTGSVTINAAGFLDTTNLGGVGGSINVSGYNISSISSGANSTNSGNQIWTGINQILFDGGPTQARTDTGVVNVLCEGNILLASGIACNVATGSNLRINVQADTNHTNSGDVTLSTVSPKSHGLFAIDGDIFVAGQNVSIFSADPGNAAMGNMTLSTTGTGQIYATNDVTVQSFGGVGFSRVLLLIADLEIYAGHDITFQAGTAAVAFAAWNGGSCDLVAGNNLSILGGSAGASSLAGFVGTDLVSLRAGRNISIIAGATPIDSAGVSVTTNAGFLRMYAGSNIFTQNSLGGGLVTIDGGAGASIEALAGSDIIFADSYAATNASTILTKPMRRFLFCGPQMVPHI